MGELSSSSNGTDYNDIGVSVGFIGNYRDNQPPTNMQNALNQFIELSIQNGNFTANHTIFFLDQLIYKELEATALKNFLKGVNNFYERKKT